jgi:hypothetical protein
MTYIAKWWLYPLLCTVDPQSAVTTRVRTEDESFRRLRSILETGQELKQEPPVASLVEGG